MRIKYMYQFCGGIKSWTGMMLSSGLLLMVAARISLISGQQGMRLSSVVTIVSVSDKYPRLIQLVSL